MIRFWFSLLFKSMPSLVLLLISVSRNSSFSSMVLRNKIHLDLSGECCVLGNGPSLKEDLENVIKEKADFFCVNHFADSDFYEIIKPKFYTFLDPYFWMPDAQESYIERRKATFSKISNSTKWPLVVFLPKHADLCFFKKNIINPNVHFFIYNSVSRIDIEDELYVKILRTRLISPYTINVLPQAIFLSVLIGYKKVSFYGADTSWHQNLLIDNETNEVKMERNHFYGSELVRVYKDCQGQEASNITHEIMKVYQTLKVYGQIKLFSDAMGAEVINKSSFSWVDCFPRQ